MPPKNLAAPEAASGEGADDDVVGPAKSKLSGEMVSYRVTKQGHGKIYTGQVVGGEHLTYSRGDIVRGVDRSIAQDLEDRFFAEIEDVEA